MLVPKLLLNSLYREFNSVRLSLKKQILQAAQSPGKMLPFSAVAKSRKEQKLRKDFFAEFLA